MTWYLCGPMSGLPEQNYPAFREACHTLRHTYSLQIVSPHETIHHPTQPDVSQWTDLIRQDVSAMAGSCQGIILLKGWSRSRGARIEFLLALQLGFEVKYYDAGVLNDFS